MNQTATSKSRSHSGSGLLPKGPALGGKVLVALSGRLDSSVTAALLKNQGFDVIGLHLQASSNRKAVEGALPFVSHCNRMIEPSFFRQLCEKIGIPYYIENVQDAFEDKVIDHFVHDVLRSRTPNPCIQCTVRIKFHYLFKKAKELGCEYVATGHYAQIIQDPSTGIAHLCRASDSERDQSHLLFEMTQEHLQRLLLPLGGISRVMVTKLATQFDIESADALGSTDRQGGDREFCFTKDPGYASFVEQRVAPPLRAKGVIRTTKGDVLCDHEGLYRLRIGEPTGLPLPVEKPEELLVVAFDLTTRAAVVGSDAYLYHQEVIVGQINWVRPTNEVRGLRVQARIRLDQKDEVFCQLTLFENKTALVQFEEPQRALVPGQMVVFYEDNEILGGGYIEKIIKKAQE